MNIRECPREGEVLDAVLSGRWGEGPGGGLSEHARACGVCRDLVQVAEAVGSDYRMMLDRARVPPPALLWWRSELRVRQEVARTAVRPITLAHAFAAAAAVGVGVALGRDWIGPLLDLVRNWYGGLAGTGSALDAIAGLSLADTPMGLPLLLAIGGCLMLAPLAAWLILSED